MSEEVLKSDISSPLYWHFLENYLVLKSLKNIAHNGRLLQEEIDILLYHCDHRIPPPTSKVVNMESLVEKITDDLVIIVKEECDKDDEKKFMEEIQKIVKNIRGSIFEFSKARYTPEIIPVILRPMLSFLRAFPLSALDETIRKTSILQKKIFAEQILKRVGIEPEKEEKEDFTMPRKKKEVIIEDKEE